jgi:hypothetical protein
MVVYLSAEGDDEGDVDEGKYSLSCGNQIVRPFCARTPSVEYKVDVFELHVPNADYGYVICIISGPCSDDMVRWCVQ